MLERHTGLEPASSRLEFCCTIRCANGALKPIIRLAFSPLAVAPGYRKCGLDGANITLLIGNVNWQGALISAAVQIEPLPSAYASIFPTPPEDSSAPFLR